ncbi:MAG: hypothetical protein ACOX60_07945 [Massiliimalia sp.]|jgi:hypothetical protein
MSKKQENKVPASKETGELKPQTLLSDPSPKLNTEAGLLFGNNNTLTEEQLEAQQTQEKSMSDSGQQTETQADHTEESSEKSDKVVIPDSSELEKTPVHETVQELAKNMRKMWREKRQQHAEKRQKAQQASPERKTPAYRKKLPMALVGLLIVFFAIIGVIWTGGFVINGIASAVRQDNLKEILKESVYPLVIVDTPQFEDVDTLDSKVVISAGIWKFIMEEENPTEKYETDDFGNMTVPQVAIEPYIRELFGNTVEIEHQMIPDTDFYIPYDEENQVYYIPKTPQILPYAPKIMSVESIGNQKYEVEVGYILAGPFWDTGRYLEDEPSKVMKYTMQKNDYDSYQILSVEQVLQEDDTPLLSEPESSALSGLESLPQVSEESSSSLPDVSSETSEESETTESSDEDTSSDESSQSDSSVAPTE